MKVLQINEYSELIQSDLVVAIDGKKARTENDFLTQIYDRLFFPDPEYMNWDAYIDWMKDLSWIAEKSISIFIYNWTDFLAESLKIGKEIFISDYEDDIFLFWDEERKYDPDDNGIKNIKVLYTFEKEESLLTKMNLIETNAAAYYARGYINRLFNMDLIAGFYKDEQWVFTGGDKNAVVYGNPRITITKDNNISSLNKSIRELMQFARGAHTIDV